MSGIDSNNRRVAFSLKINWKNRNNVWVRFNPLPYTSVGQDAVINSVKILINTEGVTRYLYGGST